VAPLPTKTRSPDIRSMFRSQRARADRASSDVRPTLLDERRRQARLNERPASRAFSPPANPLFHSAWRTMKGRYLVLFTLLPAGAAQGKIPATARDFQRISLTTPTFRLFLMGESISTGIRVCPLPRLPCGPSKPRRESGPPAWRCKENDEHANANTVRQPIGPL
jgi:hypothetical protein